MLTLAGLKRSLDGSPAGLTAEEAEEMQRALEAAAEGNAEERLSGGHLSHGRRHCTVRKRVLCSVSFVAIQQRCTAAPF